MTYQQQIAIARELNKAAKAIEVQTTNANERNHNMDSDLASCMIGVRRNKSVIEVK